MGQLDGSSWDSRWGLLSKFFRIWPWMENQGFRWGRRAKSRKLPECRLFFLYILPSYRYGKLVTQSTGCIHSLRWYQSSNKILQPRQTMLVAAQKRHWVQWPWWIIKCRIKMFGAVVVVLILCFAALWVKECKLFSITDTWCIFNAAENLKKSQNHKLLDSATSIADWKWFCLVVEQLCRQKKLVKVAC